MGDFIRDQFSRFDEMDDGWDRPDASVWEQAQRQIPVAAKPVWMNGMAMMASAAGILLLLAGGYILSLRQEVSELKTALETEQAEAQQANDEVSVLEKKYAEERAALISENEKLQLENSGIAKQKNKEERQLRQQRQTIENIALQKTLKKQSAAPVAETSEPDQNSALAELTEPATTAPVSGQNLASLPQKPTLLQAQRVADFNIPTRITPVKARSDRFEIGYEYALLGLKVPLQSDLKAKNTTTADPVNKTIFTHSHGVLFGFSPKQNWFIRTGLRTAQLSMEQYQKSGVFYDKSGEYLKPDGATANDVSLNSRTPYSELESEITLAIPSDANLKTGDWLAFTTYERFRQRYYQVPVGVEYFHGKGRLQWHLQGGVQWNRVVFEDYLLKAWAESKNWGVPVDKVKVLTKDIPSKQFMSAFAGIGLNYRLTGHWHARAGMTYSYDFINNTTGISNSQLIGNAFKLGLNYRF